METAEADMRILSGKLGAAPKGQCILPLVGYRHDEGRKEGASSSSCSGSPAGESTFRNARGPLPATIRGGPSPEPAPRAVCCELAKAQARAVPSPAGRTPAPSTTGPRRGEARTSSSGPSTSIRSDSSGTPRPDYCMGHDIYSLGVCMLELLTWSPAPYREAFMRSSGGSGGGGGGSGGQDAVTEWQLWQDPTVVMRTIMHMNRVLVPVAAGDRMKEVIEMCLTCVDNAANWGAVHDGRG
ncbi:HET-s/LopB domain protein [Cordyceps fumosorosea ARSEF 2679]|uniref:HET-s/LopB domain protein n=1 Tax=Cordyceps fumosorosea (strain ARSEF 2679) TaxID=1081104 RepID=A0A162I821_CORFA|nr:HET-s/LopB domain protein [Cordyceps fumosorosea ARSEF 2679]OAA53555.1 HET-s/LopB domain protein [Cordyceps fumosorosea ARSEF 2679]